MPKRVQPKPEPTIRKPISISDTGLRYYDLIVGPNVKVTEDRRTKTKIVNFPFEFPDGTRGIAIICKITDDPWEVGKDIKNITINFND